MTEEEIEKQKENVRQIEANLAVEGIQLHPDDKAVIMRGIEEGWSDEKMDHAIMLQLVERGVISPEHIAEPTAAAE